MNSLNFYFIFHVKGFTSTSTLKSDQWSLLKKDVEVSCLIIFDGGDATENDDFQSVWRVAFFSDATIFFNESENEVDVIGF